MPGRVADAMKPSPYQISAFAHAARERSFSRAAAKLGVTQSSITQHVAKLERIVGTQLFVRRREGLELTRAARDLFEIADRLTTLEQLVEEKIANYGDLAAGHLIVVANAPRPVMPAIARYAELHPQVRIEFSLVSWTLAMQQLREREVDVAVVTAPDEVDGLHVQTVGTTRYRAYVRRDNPIAGRRRVSLRDLANTTLIIPEDGSLTQRLVTEKATELGLELNRIVKTTTFPVVKEAVLHGVGVGLMLEDSMYRSSNLVALEIAEMPEVYRNCLITPTDKRDLRVVRSFIDVALDTMEAA